MRRLTLAIGVTLALVAFDFLAGALDVVAHELTHGVTSYSSQLEYVNESGALNEAFSDMMGTSVEFFFQEPGNGPLKADYLIGEDVVTCCATSFGAHDGIRSMADPARDGQPDHYSKLVVLPPDGEHDNGGVHSNSGIPNHAFYLAIEGGTNRTSGIKVQGVGASNREQIEKVFYRAFAYLMPSNARLTCISATLARSAAGGERTVSAQSAARTEDCSSKPSPSSLQLRRSLLGAAAVGPAVDGEPRGQGALLRLCQALGRPLMLPIALSANGYRMAWGPPLSKGGQRCTG